MISTPQAQKSVLLAMSATVILTYVAKLLPQPSAAWQEPGSMLRVAAGGVAATVGLMFLANIQPDLARLFGWFVFMGAFYTYGAPVVDRIGQITRNGSWNVVRTGGKVITPKGGGKIGKTTVDDSLGKGTGIVPKSSDTGKGTGRIPKGNTQ